MNLKDNRKTVTIFNKNIEVLCIYFVYLHKIYLKTIDLYINIMYNSFIDTENICICSLKEDC